MSVRTETRPPLRALFMMSMVLPVGLGLLQGVAGLVAGTASPIPGGQIGLVDIAAPSRA